LHQGITVWAARTFGTAFHTLRDLRTNPDGRRVRLLVSHSRSDSPTLSAGDEAFVEPLLVGDAWVQWALSVCRRERVDVLWVTREAVAAAAARDDFAAVGTRLLVPSSDALAATSAKSSVYAVAERIGLPVPPWELVVGPEQAMSALERLGSLSPYGVGVKPDSGQGAESVYRLVTAWDDLPSHPELPQERWLDHLARHPERPWLLLPWMPGVEHSVDALSAPDGRLLAGVVRSKRDGTYEQRAWHDPQLMDASTRLLRELGVAPLGNVQWRVHEGRTALLEVNPRPAGGLYRSSAALGADLLWAAIKLELDGDAGLGPVPLTLAPGQVIRTTSVDLAVPFAVDATDALAEEPRSA
jgi:carbamoylphosphate synthase large subunit